MIGNPNRAWADENTVTLDRLSLNVDRGHVFISIGGRERFLTPAEADALAGDLLACADLARAPEPPC